MKLKKRPNKQQTKGISWEACVAFGVRDSKYNYQRYLNGDALDLIADTCLDEDIIKTEHNRTKDD